MTSTNPHPDRVVHHDPVRPWMRRVLIAAAIYNIAWGALVIAFPNLIFDWTGIARPTYPQIWQCVGMIVGVYGLGYAAAASNPIAHWPIVMVGLLGKIFGPVGFLGAVAQGHLPLAFGVTILTNDLVWWAPFALILIHARRHHSEARHALWRPDPEHDEPPAAAQTRHAP